MKNTLKAMLLVAAAFLTGCASMNTLSPEDRASIRTVKVVVEDNPDGIFMYAPGDDLKAAGLVLFNGPVGLIQSLLNSDTAKAGAEILRAHLKQNDISIQSIVANEVAKKMNELGYKPVESGHDALLKVNIVGFGFNQARPLSSELKGAVYLTAQLYRTNGEPWLNKRINFCGVFTDFKSYTTEQVLSDPSIARDQFTQCSAIAFADIAKGYGR